MSNHNILYHGEKLTELAFSATHAKVHTQDGIINFNLDKKVTKWSVPFLISLNVVFTTLLILGIRYHWNICVTGFFGLILFLLLAATIRMVSMTLAKTPLLGIDTNSNILTVYNFRAAGTSIEIGDIDFILVLHSVITNKNIERDSLAYIVTKDKRILFITSSILLFQENKWIDDTIRMLGYIVGKRVLIARVYSSNPNESAELLIREYLSKGNSTLTRDNLGSAIS